MNENKHFKGLFYGVQIFMTDGETAGDCDGTYKGKKYFNCAKDAGIWYALYFVHKRKKKTKK